MCVKNFRLVPWHVSSSLFWKADRSDSFAGPQRLNADDLFTSRRPGSDLPLFLLAYTLYSGAPLYLHLSHAGACRLAKKGL